MSKLKTFLELVENLPSETVSYLDDEIVKRTGQAISDLLENGTFRTYETTVLKELATQKQPLIGSPTAIPSLSFQNCILS